jgi:hypothetical protein
MYNRRAALTIGFHGCSVASRDQLLRDGPVKISENDYDWLGHGFYVWENDLARATNWGKNKFGADGSVIGVVIDLGNCLDLLDSANLLMLKGAYNLYASTEPEVRKNSSDRDKLTRFLDCAVINSLCASTDKRKNSLNGDPFQTVRGMFEEGEEIYPGAGFRDRTHIQICIRDLECIKGFFLPRKSK